MVTDGYISKSDDNWIYNKNFITLFTEYNKMLKHKAKVKLLLESIEA